MSDQHRQPRCLCGNQDYPATLARELRREDKRGRVVWVKTADPGWGGGIERLTCTAVACGRTFTRTIGEAPPRRRREGDE